MARIENRTPPAHAEVVVQRLGGTGATATLCGIEPASVSGWKKNGISGLRTDLLKALRPDVFVDLDAAVEAERSKVEEQQQAAA